jgi:hypothetical protein
MNGVVVTRRLCFVGDVSTLPPKPTMLDVINFDDIDVGDNAVVDE